MSTHRPEKSGSAPDCARLDTPPTQEDIRDWLASHQVELSIISTHFDSPNEAHLYAACRDCGAVYIAPITIGPFLRKQ